MISLDKMAGYIRTKVKLGSKTGEVELYIDPKVLIVQTAAGPVISKPNDCVGILYHTADGKLEVQYPEE